MYPCAGVFSRDLMILKQRLPYVEAENDNTEPASGICQPSASVRPQSNLSAHETLPEGGVWSLAFEAFVLHFGEENPEMDAIKMARAAAREWNKMPTTRKMTFFDKALAKQGRKTVFKKLFEEPEDICCLQRKKRKKKRRRKRKACPKKPACPRRKKRRSCSTKKKSVSCRRR